MTDRPSSRVESDRVEAARQEWVDNGWLSASDGMCAVLSLFRVNRILMGRIEQTLRPFELTFARLEILVLLTFSRRGGLSIGRLGELLQVHATSVSSAVDRLESSGLVTRMAHPDDGRGVIATVTPVGRAAAAATGAINSEVFEQLSLTADEFARLWAVLRALRSNAGDFAATPPRRVGRSAVGRRGC